MKKAIFAAILTSALVTPFAAQAEGAYVGLNVGRAEQKLNIDNFGSADDSDTGFKLYGGYAINPNFGVELGYAQLGKGSVDFAGNTATAKPNSLYVAVTGNLPINEQISLFAKAGVSANRTKVSALGDESTESNTSAIFGIGAAYNFSKNISVVAEYEDFGKLIKEDGGNLKGNLLSVGLRYTF